MLHNLIEDIVSPLDGSTEIADVKCKITLYPIALLHTFVARAEVLLRQMICFAGDRLNLPL